MVYFQTIPFHTFGMTMHRIFLLGICGICLWPIDALAQPAEGNDAASPEPVAAFLEHCYDPIRLTGHPKLPAPGNDSAWIEADESVRASLQVKMPSKPAFLRPTDGDGFLLLQFRQRVLVDAKGADNNETRQSCQIVYQGRETTEVVYNALVDLFDGLDGSRSSRVIRGCGYDTPEGWEQWVWSDNPSKDDHSWRMYEAETRRGAGSGESTCIFATTDRYYTAMDLVHVRLMAKESAPELIIIELLRTYRPDRDAPKPKPKVTVQPLGTPADQGDDEQREEQDKEM